MMRYISLALLMCSLSIGQCLATIPEPPPVPDPPPGYGGDTTPTTPAETATQNTVLNLSQSSIVSVINNIGRSFRFLTLDFSPPPATSGDLIKNLSLVTDVSYASFQDDIVGSGGHDRTESAYLTGQIGDKVAFGLGIGETYYRTGEPLDIYQTVDTFSGYTTYAVTSEFNLGAFFTYSKFDIEDSLVFDPGSGTTVNLANQFDRYGLGALAAYRKKLDFATLGLSTAVASFNKRSLNTIFEQRDSASITTFDIERALTDNLSVDVYATFYTLLDNQGPSDGTYWIFGTDVSYHLTRHWLMSAGYSTMAWNDDYQEQRFNGTIAYTW